METLNGLITINLEQMLEPFVAGNPPKIDGWIYTTPYLEQFERFTSFLYPKIVCDNLLDDNGCLYYFPETAKDKPTRTAYRETKVNEMVTFANAITGNHSNNVGDMYLISYKDSVEKKCKGFHVDIENLNIVIRRILPKIISVRYVFNPREYFRPMSVLKEHDCSKISCEFNPNESFFESVFPPDFEAKICMEGFFPVLIEYIDSCSQEYTEKIKQIKRWKP